MILRVVSAYRLCKSEGPLTMYQQHLHHWYKQNIMTCPREKILQDLAKEVQQWQTEGDTIIVMADMNEDVEAEDIAAFCRETQLVEAINHLHGTSPTPTHQRGSKVIDGIFIPRTLLAEARGGFLPFGEVTISNHRAVWLDILARYFQMLDNQDIVWPSGQRLKCQDPRIVQKYNDFLVQAIEQEHIMQKITQLYQKESLATEKEKQEQWELIDQHLTTTKIEAEKQCRKLHAGKVPWTPAVTQPIYKILYWKGIQKRLKGGKISGTVLWKWASQGVETFKNEHLQMTGEEASEKIKSAVQDYKQIKKQSDRRDIWVAQMITAQAAARNMMKIKLWKRL